MAENGFKDKNNESQLIFTGSYKRNVIRNWFLSSGNDGSRHSDLASLHFNLLSVVLRLLCSNQSSTGPAYWICHTAGMLFSSSSAPDWKRSVCSYTDMKMSCFKAAIWHFQRIWVQYVYVKSVFGAYENIAGLQDSFTLYVFFKCKIGI